MQTPIFDATELLLFVVHVYQALDEMSLRLLEKTMELERLQEERDRERAEWEEYRQHEVEDIAKALAVAKCESLALEQLLDEERSAQLKRDDEWKVKLKEARQRGGWQGRQGERMVDKGKVRAADMEAQRQVADARKEGETMQQVEAERKAVQKARGDFERQREILLAEMAAERKRISAMNRKQRRVQGRAWAAGKSRIKEKLIVLQVWRQWVCHHLEGVRR